MSNSESNPPPSTAPTAPDASPAAPTFRTSLLVFSVLAILSYLVHGTLEEILLALFPSYEDAITRFALISPVAFMFACLFNWRALGGNAPRFLRIGSDVPACDCEVCSPPEDDDSPRH